METHRFEGIIVRTYPSGEDDLVLRVISQEHGKISLIAKHARKSRKRFGPPFDLLDRGIFEISTSRSSLHPVHGFDPRMTLKRLRHDLDRLTTASAICEAFDVLIHESGDNSAQIFDVLGLGLQAIDEANGPKEILRSCHVCLASLLRVTGYLDEQTCRVPSANNLRQILGLIENHADRKFQSGAAVMGIVEGLREQRV